MIKFIVNAVNALCFQEGIPRLRKRLSGNHSALSSIDDELSSSYVDLLAKRGAVWKARL